MTADLCVAPAHGGTFLVAAGFQHGVFAVLVLDAQHGLLEFFGYCLIPSNKGQRMMGIKGNGGEGKSQIGAVLGALLGSNMKDGSIGKISENRFARADLEHILLCVDDDMRMEALRQTNYVKSIVTAQGKMDLERKGKQSYQGWMFARLLAFSFSCTSQRMRHLSLTGFVHSISETPELPSTLLM